MAQPCPAVAFVIPVLVSMQFVRVSSGVLSPLRSRTTRPLFLAKDTAVLQESLHASDDHTLSFRQPAAVSVANSDIVYIRKKIDSLTLQCKKAEDKDNDQIDQIDRELRAVSGRLAGYVAKQSAETHEANDASAMIVKLKDQIKRVNSMWWSQETAINATLRSVQRDQTKFGELNKISKKCKSLVLAAIRTATPVARSPFGKADSAFIQGCGADVAAPMLAVGHTLLREAGNFSTNFSRQAFHDALRRASGSFAFPSLRKSWPSHSKPPSKAKAKAANSCKLPKGAVNCNVLSSELDTLAKRLAEENNKAIILRRRHWDGYYERTKQLNLRIAGTEAQLSRSNTEIVRVAGIQAGLASARAAVEQRAQVAKTDAAQMKATCKSGTESYEAKLGNVMRKRQDLVDKIAGRKVAIQDCETTNWIFSKCSKACKKTPFELPGMMDASRIITRVGTGFGAICQPLSARLTCNDKPCPTDCLVNSWGSWGSCSKACGGGTRARTRLVVKQAKDGGSPCPSIEQRKSCNVQSCTDGCKLKEWTAWTACSRGCKFNAASAPGQQKRIREVDGKGGRSACPSAKDKSRLQVRQCNNKQCPKRITCNEKEDVLFLLDASGAAGKDYQHELSLVNAIVGKSSGKASFGAMSYGKEVKILSRIVKRPQFSANAPTPGGSRDAAKALVLGRSLFADTRGGRPKIVVILLGGAPSTSVDTKKAAKQLRAAGVRVVVGLVDDGSSFARKEACQIASRPCSANVEAVKSWKQWTQEPDRMLAAICRDVVF